MNTLRTELRVAESRTLIVFPSDNVEVVSGRMFATDDLWWAYVLDAEDVEVFVQVNEQKEIGSERWISARGTVESPGWTKHTFHGMRYFDVSVRARARPNCSVGKVHNAVLYVTNGVPDAPPGVLFFGRSS